jgi:transposase-like protein
MARRKRGTPEQQARRALIACTDNLTGFAQAIEAVYPQTDI